jgi:glycosyltransferase involved in cell wall biosynthesis
MTSSIPSQRAISDISVVIPILNEMETLPRLLDALLQQTLLPLEIIVVDSGSTDGSIQVVEQRARQQGLGAGGCRVIVNPDGMPGANRNRGVAEAKGEWIAFLDGGITPNIDWLEQLKACAGVSGTKAVFGQCCFEADAAFEKAVCALSYGCKTVHPVLPASLFHRSVFTQAGWFRQDLRSAEDTLWLREVERIFGPRKVCDAALVYYKHFPANFSSAIRKWVLYEQGVVRAGLYDRSRWVMNGFFGLLAVCLVVMPSTGVMLLLAYAFVRGLLDPMRRSQAVCWWGNKPAAVMIALGLGVLLDAAKVYGGWTARLWKVNR